MIIVFFEEGDSGGLVLLIDPGQQMKNVTQSLNVDVRKVWIR